MPVEVQLRVNKLLFSGRQDVTITPSQLLSLFTVSADIKSQVKTIEVVNLGTVPIYFGVDATVTTNNAGGIIQKNQTKEIPLLSLADSPYFIASTNCPMGLVLWG